MAGIGRNGFCDEAISRHGKREIASLEAGRSDTLWMNPLAMTAKELPAAACPAARDGSLAMTSTRRNTG